MRHVLFWFCIIVITLLSLGRPLTAQETSIGYHVWIEDDDPRLRLKAPTPCKLFVNEVRNEKCPASGFTNEPRSLAENERFGGWANIYKDSEETGLLNVNFWLRDCDGLAGDDLKGCQELNDSLKVRKYTLEFKNRESQIFPSMGLHVKALTLPIKFRGGYSEEVAGTMVRVPSRAEAGVSGNFFAGYRFAREKYYYERGAARDPYTTIHFTPGLFVGASVVGVGKETTRTAGNDRLDESVNTGALSAGFGALGGWRNFSLGAFVGWDRALGSTGRLWDFDRRPYIGLGISIDTFLGATGRL